MAFVWYWYFSFGLEGIFSGHPWGEPFFKGKGFPHNISPDYYQFIPKDMHLRANFVKKCFDRSHPTLKLGLWTTNEKNNNGYCDICPNNICHSNICHISLNKLRSSSLLILLPIFNRYWLNWNLSETTSQPLFLHGR